MKSLFLLLASCLVSDFTTTAFMNPRCPSSVSETPTTTLFMDKKKTGKPRSSGGGGFGAALQTPSFSYAGSVRPGKQSPQRVVLDESIVKPDYWKTGKPSAPRPMLPWVVEVKTPVEIEKMRKSGRLAREILDMAGRAVLAGVTTDEIDTLVHNRIVEVRRKG
jgi:methionyl aminopeptidase